MNRRVLLVVLALVALSLLLAACGGDDEDDGKDDKGGSASVPVVEIRPYTDWTLTVASANPRLDMELALLAAYPEYAPDYDDGYDVAGGSFYGLLLSPDGEQIVATGNFDLAQPVDGENDQDVICRYTIADASILCTVTGPDFADVRSDSTLAAWTPDGTRLIVHEDWIKRARDSDMWLVDVATMTVTNLTDDHYTGRYTGQAVDEPVTADHTPLWSPNGDLYFFRIEGLEQGHTHVLYRIAGGSGEAERVLEMPDTMGDFDIHDTTRVKMSPDGTRIALLPMRLNDGLLYGIWMIDLAANTVEEFMPTADLQGAVPAWSDAAEDNTLLLLPQEIAWGVDGSTLFVAVNNEQYLTGQEALNLLAVDVATKDVAALIDYAAYESERDVFEQIDELPFFPWLLTPDRSTVIYGQRRTTDDENTLHAAPATFDQEPVVVGTVPVTLFRSIFGFETVVYFGQTGTNGNILVGRVLFKVE